MEWQSASRVLSASTLSNNTGSLTSSGLHLFEYNHSRVLHMRASHLRRMRVRECGVANCHIWEEAWRDATA